MTAAQRGRTKSMFPPAWLEARSRMLGADAPVEYRSLAGVLEQGGEQLGKLQALYQAESAAASPVPPLLVFVDDDLSDLFRCIAAGAANLLPPEDEVENVDPLEVEADVRLLERYLAVAVLAAEHPSVPDRVRSTFRGAADALDSWGEQMTAAVRTIAEMHLSSALANGG
jgi:hypothetical protein